MKVEKCNLGVSSLLIWIQRPIVAVIDNVLSLPQAIVNYEIGNITIQEDLECSNSDVFEGENSLYNQHAPQKPQLIQGEDYFKNKAPEAAKVIAGPGEWEETRDPNDMNVLPREGKMVRLKADVAREHGLQSRWDYELDDEGRINFHAKRQRKHDVPEGGCKLQAMWDMTLRPPVW